MTPKTYIAFMDVMGTTRMAEENPQKYYSCLELFRKIISDSSSKLDEEAKVFFFSDCAYIGSNNLYDILSYLQEVRSQLLSNELFLKGSLLLGSLDEKEANEDMKEMEDYERKCKIIRGNYFGKDVVELYKLERKLHGIGIILQLSETIISSQKRINEKIIDTIYLADNKRRVESYKDIIFPEYDRTQNTVSIIIKNMFMAKTKEKYLAKYYIPILISLINSINWNVLCDDEKTEENKAAKLIINNVIDRTFEKYIKDIVGYELIIFSLLHAINSDIDQENQIEERENIEKTIINNKSLLSEMEHIPDKIFPSNNRENIYQKLLIEYGNKISSMQKNEEKKE